VGAQGEEGGGVGTVQGTQPSKTSSQRHAPVLVVEVRLLYALVLGATVLEPDLDLCLRQLEGLCQLEPPRPGYVLAAVVLHLEAQRLLAGEGGALAALAGVAAAPARHSETCWEDANT